jgi:transposase
MPRTRLPYSPEFRQQINDLVRAGRGPEELPREFEPTAQLINHWVKQAGLEAGHRQGGLTTAERQELVRLRRGIKGDRLEREILAEVADCPPRRGDFTWSARAVIVICSARIS